MIRIITDSASDLSVEKAAQLGVEIIPLSITFGDKSYKEGFEITQEEFYQRLAITKNLPTTSQPSPEDFVSHFIRVKEAGDGAVVILLSSRLSGTYQSANIARQLVGYDDIHLVDSKSVTVGMQLLIDEAVKMLAAGSSAKETADRLRKMADRVVLIAMVDTLEYLYRGGRLSKSSRIAGGILGFKPIIAIEDGEIKVLGKGRGIKQSLQKVLEFVSEEKSIVSGTKYYFGYTKIEENCTLLMELAAKSLNVSNAVVSPVGCAIGTHAGPGASVICYLAKE